MLYRILVIDDDKIVSRTVEKCLRGSEFDVVTCGSGVEGLQNARRQPPDLVILDILMPGMDGISVAKELRADPLLSEVPILFLSAKSRQEDKIAGFRAGADDYLTKPFNVDELLLRVRAILRRSASPRNEALAEETDPVFSSDPLAGSSHYGSKRERTRKKIPLRIISLGPYTLDTRTYELSTPARGNVRLTPVQFDLVYHMMSHVGEIFSPSRLLDEVWDYPSNTGSPDLVRVHIKNLRARIEADPANPQFIVTVPGYGYTIPPEELLTDTEAGPYGRTPNSSPAAQPSN